MEIIPEEEKILRVSREYYSTTSSPSKITSSSEEFAALVELPASGAAKEKSAKTL